MATVITTPVPAPALKDIHFSLEKYRQGEITLGRAGEIVGLPLRTMLLLAAQRGIPFQYSTRDLEKDLKAVKIERK